MDVTTHLEPEADVVDVDRDQMAADWWCLHVTALPLAQLVPYMSAMLGHLEAPTHHPSTQGSTEYRGLLADMAPEHQTSGT